MKVQTEIRISAPSWYRLGKDLHPLIQRSVEAAVAVVPDSVQRHGTRQGQVRGQGQGQGKVQGQVRGQGQETQIVSVAVLLAGKQKLRALNRTFCNQDKTTDVLAFPADPAVAAFAHKEQILPLGDLAIGWEPCLASATAFAATPRQQLQHLIVHGTLHLLGLNHKTDSQTRRMRSLESAALQSLAVPDPWRGLDTARGTAQDKSQGKAQGKPQGKVRGKPQGKAQDKPQGTAQGKPRDTAQGKPRDTAQGKPQARTRRKKANLPPAQSAA